MNKKALTTLEYTKIIRRLTEYASSPMGKALCEKLLPAADMNAIKGLQRQTHDALNRLLRKGTPTFHGAKDIRASLKRLEVGSTIGTGELLLISGLLENTARVKSYGRRELADEQADSLDAMFAALEPLSKLASEIRRCIISEAEISDDASPELKRIRRSIRGANDRIHTQMNSIVNSSTRSYLQDAVVTMRNGRYCIPVKAEYKGQVPGMIHDQSSSGSTLFIEPMAIVKLNNDIRELELKEAAAIETILAVLSQLAGEHIAVLQTDLELMVELDFIFARGALAVALNASEPILNNDGRINIRQARHPLIEAGSVVPIDVRLGDDFNLLIITGPNTGGKTVSLKTVGLLTLMAQSGLHIPAGDRSEIAVFEEVYADIGDEQSIEQSLSTFSSHMRNVVQFLEQADRKSLVLFDELGAGTDPTEGAALAISILSHLHRQDIRTMATTHYSELKVYALSTPGVENASCEFDVDTLKPTYRLLIGIPGKSNAFAISSKLGLPDFIISDARNHISEEAESFEDVISNLEESRKAVEREQLEIEQRQQEIRKLQSSLEAKKEQWDMRREKIIQQANEEAHTILQEAKEYADQTIRQFNKYGKASGSVREMEQERQKLGQKLSNTRKKMSKQQPVVTSGGLKPADLHIGDMVKVLSLNLNGTVSTLPDSKGLLYIQAGIIRTKVQLSDLILVDDPVITAPDMQRTGSGKIKMSKSAGIRTEINLLGKTVDEAISELDKYLDDACLAHLPSVRIVHGKGTGALRKGIHSYLKRQHYIASYQLGEFGEGDSGVTVVTFK